jgi:hypothetical protein
VRPEQLTFLWGNGGGVVSALLLMVRLQPKTVQLHTNTLCILYLRINSSKVAQELTWVWQLPAIKYAVRLLQAPQHAKFSFFASNEVLGIWTVCW